MHRSRASAEHDAPAATAARGTRRSPWAVLILLSVAEFMVILDVTVVNVALPSISRALHFAAGDLQWVITAYVLVSGGLVLLGGRASDFAGRRRMFWAGLALFTTASLGSGVAPSAAILLATRAAQGLGAALLTPAALSIITTTYTGPQRARALGAWGALGGAGAAVGVLAGGMLTSWLGWRSVFLINVPAGMIVGILSARLLPVAAPAGRVRDLDLPGALLVTAGLATAVYALASAPAHGWGSARTLLLLAVSSSLLIGFAFVESRAARPLLPPSTWRNRPLVSGAAMNLGATAVLVGAFFLNSLYLQDVERTSALVTGAEFLPLVAVIGLGAHVTAQVLPRTGSRVIAAAGLVLMAGGALLLSQASRQDSYLTGLLPGLLVLGAGTGLVYPAASVTAMSEVHEDNAGLASGFMTAAHEIGAALGVAVFAAVATGSGGLAEGYRHGFTIAALAAFVLALAAAVAVPAVRPAPGTRVAVH
jgi:EmrB/QacA subfamily drug resistance transporter